MDYRRFGQTIVARIDKNEEILEKIRELAEKEHIKLASVNALGALQSFTAGVYDTAKKTYYSHEYSGIFELLSLTGTINTMDGQLYTHIHISASDQTGAVFGGHLNRAVVSATCELVITVIDGSVDRKFDEETGLNLFRF